MSVESLKIELLNQMRRQMNGAVVDAMKQVNGTALLSYGVSVPTLRTLALAYHPNHELALSMFTSKVRELKLSALYVEDYQLITSEQIAQWRTLIPNIEIADHLATALFYRLPNVFAVALQWSDDPALEVQRAALMMAGRSLKEFRSSVLTTTLTESISATTATTATTIPTITAAISNIIPATAVTTSNPIPATTTTTTIPTIPSITIFSTASNTSNTIPATTTTIPTIPSITIFSTASDTSDTSNTIPASAIPVTTSNPIPATISITPSNSTPTPSVSITPSNSAPDIPPAVPIIMSNPASISTAEFPSDAASSSSAAPSSKSCSFSDSLLETSSKLHPNSLPENLCESCLILAAKFLTATNHNILNAVVYLLVNLAKTTPVNKAAVEKFLQEKGSGANPPQYIIDEVTWQITD